MIFLDRWISNNHKKIQKYPRSIIFPSDFWSVSAWTKLMTGWWFGTLFIFPIYWEFHHPNWRTHIFQRVFSSSTNQLLENPTCSIIFHHFPSFSYGFPMVFLWLILDSPSQNYRMVSPLRRTLRRSVWPPWAPTIRRWSARTDPPVGIRNGRIPIQARKVCCEAEVILGIYFGNPILMISNDYMCVGNVDGWTYK